MKKDKKLQRRWKTVSGLVALAVALLIGFSADQFTIVSHAESKGKVTATSAKIRKDPSTSSESLGSVQQDGEVSISGQLSASDGYTWYQVVFDGNKQGYIRSDLVKITDGSTPATVTAGSGTTTTPTASTPTTSTPDEALVAVTAVNPVSASVVGGQAVRVRQNASTTSRIVTTAQSGLALTVTGTAVGTDGKDWYQVNFIANSAEVNGFIRSDYVKVDGELTEVGGDETPDEPDEPDVPAEPEPVEVKDWDTYYEGGKWHLIYNGTGDSYDLQNIFDISEQNKTVAEDALAANKKLKVVIVLLVILMVGLAALVSYLIFKLKDMADSAYFSEVERETVRRRTADRPAGSGQRVMHTVGTEKRPGGQRTVGGNGGQRPAGSGDQRPAGSSQGQRPAGSSQGQRPAGSSQGQRPAGSSQGQRPAGSSQGQRPAGSSQAQRPAGSSQGQRPAGSGQGQRPSGAPAQGGQQREPGWKAKNFMADNDEFEFSFMDDWDGEDDK